MPTKWEDCDNKEFENSSNLARHRSIHIIDIHVCNLCQESIKNIYLGKVHIRRIHPKEFEVTKDFKDLLFKNGDIST